MKFEDKCKLRGIEFIQTPEGYILKYNDKRAFVTTAVLLQMPHEAYDAEEDIFDDELPDGTVLSHKEIVHHKQVTQEDIDGQISAMLDYFILSVGGKEYV